MSPPDEPSAVSAERTPQLWLRANDQACVVAAVLLGCGLLVGGWIYQGGLRGEIVDVDVVPRKSANFQVDINSAKAAEFALLPDIGETLAQRMVTWREEHGRFSHIDQLRKVKGIGPKKFESIRPFLLPIALPKENREEALAASR